MWNLLCEERECTKMEQTVKAYERIEELVNHKIRHATGERHDVRLYFEEFFGQDFVHYVYPKNIFETNVDYRVYYVFHGQYFSEVVVREDCSQIETNPLRIKTLYYTRSLNSEKYGVQLDIAFENRSNIKFDSFGDSPDGWRRSFSEIIHDIYLRISIS